MSTCFIQLGFLATYSQWSLPVEGINISSIGLLQQDNGAFLLVLHQVLIEVADWSIRLSR